MDLLLQQLSCLKLWSADTTWENKIWFLWRVRQANISTLEQLLKRKALGWVFQKGYSTSVVHKFLNAVFQSWTTHTIIFLLSPQPTFVLNFISKSGCPWEVEVHTYKYRVPLNHTRNFSFSMSMWFSNTAEIVFWRSPGRAGAHFKWESCAMCLKLLLSCPRCSLTPVAIQS